jgi:hypothetical protein
LVAQSPVPEIGSPFPVLVPVPEVRNPISGTVHRSFSSFSGSDACSVCAVHHCPPVRFTKTEREALPLSSFELCSIQQKRFGSLLSSSALFNKNYEKLYIYLEKRFALFFQALLYLYKNEE